MAKALLVVMCAALAGCTSFGERAMTPWERSISEADPTTTPQVAAINGSDMMRHSLAGGQPLQSFPMIHRFCLAILATLLISNSVRAAEPTAH